MPPVITLSVEKRCGAATIKVRVSASSVKRGLQLCGENARALSLKPGRLTVPEAPHTATPVQSHPEAA